MMRLHCLTFQSLLTKVRQDLPIPILRRKKTQTKYHNSMKSGRGTNKNSSIHVVHWSAIYYGHFCLSFVSIRCSTDYGHNSDTTVSIKKNLIARQRYRFVRQWASCKKTDTFFCFYPTYAYIKKKKKKTRKFQS